MCFTHSISATFSHWKSVLSLLFSHLMRTFSPSVSFYFTFRLPKMCLLDIGICKIYMIKWTCLLYNPQTIKCDHKVGLLKIRSVAAAQQYFTFLYLRTRIYIYFFSNFPITYVRRALGKYFRRNTNNDNCEISGIPLKSTRSDVHQQL